MPAFTEERPLHQCHCGAGATFMVRSFFGTYALRKWLTDKYVGLAKMSTWAVCNNHIDHAVLNNVERVRKFNNARDSKIITIIDPITR